MRKHEHPVDFSRTGKPSDNSFIGSFNGKFRAQQDIRLTRDLAEAGRHLKVTLHDHVIIIGSSGETSLRSIGLI